MGDPEPTSKGKWQGKTWSTNAKNGEYMGMIWESMEEFVGAISRVKSSGVKHAFIVRHSDYP